MTDNHSLCMLCVHQPIIYIIPVIIFAFEQAEQVKTHFFTSLLYYFLQKQITLFLQQFFTLCVCVHMQMPALMWTLGCVTWGFVLVAVQQSRVCSVPKELANDARLEETGETRTIFIKSHKNRFQGAASSSISEHFFVFSQSSSHSWWL